MEALLKNTETYVFDLLKEKLPKDFIYHTFLHTRRVHESAKEIIEASEISKEDQLIIELSAWFHDTGYINDSKTHEIESCKIASAFLKKHQVDAHIIKAVENCILATKLETAPKNFNEEVIKDADTSHLAKNYFNNVSDLLRQELNIQGIANFTNKEWREENIMLFTKKHKFYTPYAVNNWEKKKINI
ncbi:HD domain-containing protein [Aquimarina agarivorans]|uniref:HD domain-containing protein n=1 Tax=Aquimarina agarivorans TaxID=980584 RepID=UPI00030505D4|nr:HD domain-containing protein [Aquimarina agarivorans]